jgi:hypothetical protein
MHTQKKVLVSSILILGNFADSHLAAFLHGDLRSVGVEP